MTYTKVLWSLVPSQSRERWGQRGSRAGWALEEFSEWEGIFLVTQASLTTPCILPNAPTNVAFILSLTGAGKPFQYWVPLIMKLASLVLIMCARQCYFSPWSKWEQTCSRLLMKLFKTLKMVCHLSWVSSPGRPPAVPQMTHTEWLSFQTSANLVTFSSSLAYFGLLVLFLGEKRWHHQLDPILQI